MATRDSLLRSAAIGIDAKRQQLVAFVFAGAMAGLAGGLFAFSKGSIFPDEMSIPRSFDALLMVLLGRSEEHTSELQSLMRISYAVFCLKKKKQKYTRGTRVYNRATTRHNITIP